MAIGACGDEAETAAEATPTATAAATPSATAVASGGSGAVALLDRANSCTAAPETTQGPYYAGKGERDMRIDDDNVYSQADAEGTPLLLTLERAGEEVLAAGTIVISA